MEVDDVPNLDYRQRKWEGKRRGERKDRKGEMRGMAGRGEGR